MSNNKEVSDCCQAELVEDFKNNPTDHHDPIEIYTCSMCKQECEAVEKYKCDVCKDTREVEIIGESETDEVAVIDVKPCPVCRSED